MSRRRVDSSRLACAITPVVEHLEDRRLMAGDASVIRSTPYALDFDADRGGLLDKDGQGTGFSWIAPNKNNDEYQAALLDLDTAAGVLKITTAGNATAGGPWENDNTLVNALQTGFNATVAGGWQITTRLVGPLSFIDNASEQAGLYFGPDQDNYVKLVAIAQPTGTFLQFIDEQKPGASFVHQISSSASYTNIGSFANINTLDLVLAGDASTGQINAFYRINGGALTQVNQTLTLTGSQKSLFFSANGKAGLMAMHKNNLGAMTATFDRFEIAAGTPQTSRPSVRADGVTPANGETDVWRDAFIAAAVNLPNVGKGVATSSLNSNTVYITRTSDGVKIPSHVSTSGAGDVIILNPDSPLDANTSYTFTVTPGLKDTSGAAFLPYTMTFMTGSNITPVDPNIAFEKVQLPTAQGQQYSAVTMGPDGKLYAASLSGLIQRFTINPDGTLGSPQNITTVQTANGGSRFITGIEFDPASTANNLILWVNNGQYAFENASDWTGKLSRLSGANLETYQDYVVGLPRAIRDHLNNQMRFGPDGKLYFAMGSNSAMGAADAPWGDRPERLLSAAVLQINTVGLKARIDAGQGPLDVKTEDRGASNYNPWAANALVKIYASGVRNAYDVVWHSNGHLYVPTNGSAAGGNAPSYPNSIFSGQRIDEGTNGPYDGTLVPGLTNIGTSESDWLFDVVQGGYYGHPNPTRGEYVFNGGNPTDGVDPYEVTQYPAGVLPDRNYRGVAWDFGKNHSPNGAIEYTGNAFGGALTGKLMVARYSGGSDIVVLTVGANGAITGSTSGIAGLNGFVNPLDIIENTATGYLYVVDHGAGTIVLARPIAPGANITASKSELYFNDDYAGSNTTPSPTQTIRISNTGTQPLVIPGTGLSLSNTTNWVITSKPDLPVTVPVGGYIEIGVAFKATNSTGVKTATLTINSNDQDTPNLVINLRGLAASGTGGQTEPSLQRILDLYRLPIVTGDANPGNTNLFSPSEPLLSVNDEVLAQQFKKAGAGLVTIEPLAAYAGGSPAVRFGHYRPGTPGLSTELLTVSGTTAQSVNPLITGVTSFDPGTSPFGLYVNFPIFKNTAYSEDALNTKENTAANRRKMRFYPLKNPDGSVVPNAYVFTSEDFVNDGTGGYDTNDFVGIIRNVQIVAAGPQVGIENLDGAPFADRMVFNRIQIQPPDAKKDENGEYTIFPPNNVVHDTGRMRIRNTGSAPLTVNSVSVSNGWQLVDPPAAGTQIAPGGFLDVTVKFVATNKPSGQTGNQTIDPSGRYKDYGGAWSGTLTINTDDADEPTTTVQLAGWWQYKSESDMEPSLETMVNRLYGYKTTILNPGQQIGLTPDAGTLAPLGEEVISQYWVRADTNLNVTVTQLAAYHTQGGTATVKWAEKGSTIQNTLFIHEGVDGQSLLPHVQGGTAIAGGSFAGPPAGNGNNPERAFQFRIDSEWGDWTMQKPVLTQPQDVGLHVRFWPARDRNGVIIPNTWIMGMDYQGINYDYQDNVYLVQNIRPANPPTPAAPTAQSTGAGISLDWPDNTGFPTTSGYHVYRSTSATSGFAKITTSAVTASQYVDGTAAPGTTYYYKVSAVHAWGGESSQSAAVSAVRQADTVAPATPTGLSAANGVGGITLGWTANTEPDLAGYRVYRSATLNGTYSVLNGGAIVTGAGFTDTLTQSGQTWFYKVTAVDSSNNESAQSGAVSATRGDSTPPAAPANLNAGGSTSGVALTWNANVESDLAGYKVYRSTSSTTGFAALNGGALITGVSSFTDTTGTPGQLYYYYVTAVDTAGNESVASTTRSATRSTSSSGAVLRINVGGGSYTDGQGNLWEADRGFTGGTASTSAYDVLGTTDDQLFYNRRFGAFTYNLPVANGTYTLRLYFADSAFTTAGSRTFNVVANGTTILSNYDIAADGGGKTALVKSFTVTVNNSVLALSFQKLIENPLLSGIELLAQDVDTTPPAQPTGFAATGSSTGIALGWTANGESDLWGYDVYRSDSAGGTFTKLNAAPITATSYNDAAAPSGAASYYRVVAVDLAGNVSTPATANATRPAEGNPKPDAPTGLTAVGNGSAIVLDWNDNTESDLAGYVVYRSKYATGGFSKISGTLTTSAFTDTTATAGTTWYYRVAARDTAQQESAYATLSATRSSTDTTPPTTPGGVSATGAPAGITLSWTANSESDLAGYDVYRSDSPSGSFVKLNSALLTGTSFVDTNAPFGIVSYYRVVAVDRSLNASSPASTSATRPTADTTPPATPAGFSATGATSGITLRWTANSESDLAGYNIYRASSANGTYGKLNASPVTGTSYTDTSAPAGASSFYRLIAVDASGNESPAASASAFRPSQGGTGLLGQYYDTDKFTNLKLTRVDSKIDFFWDKAAPSSALGADTFTIRWTGQVMAQTTEAYTFSTQANDGVRLWINGQLVIDRWTARAGMDDDFAAPIQLVAGQRYDIKLEYMETTGQAGVRLLWQTPTIARQIVPTAALFAPGT